MDPSGFGQTPPAAPLGWAVPPVVPKRSPLARIAGGVGALVVIAIIAIVLYSVFGGGGPKDAGKVVFSTDPAAAGQNSGSHACDVGSQVTTVKAGTAVYLTFVFKDNVGDATVSWSIQKDGQPFYGPTALSASDTKGLDCLTFTDDMSVLGPGTYTITATANDKTIAEGTLVITQ